MDLGIHLNQVNFSSLLDALKLTKKLGANILQVYFGDKRLTTLREKYKFTSNEIKTIKLFLKENNIKLVIHAILTLNFCNDPTSQRYQWGIDNLVYDMIESNKLGAFGCVIHMGSYKTQKISITSDECIKNFIKSLIIVLEKTQKIKIILETPVYKKYKIGNNLENFALLYNSIPEIYKKRIKTCIDTQHIFASGYDISTKDGIKNYLNHFIDLIGVKNLALIHLNDSLKELNSGIDRHAPIGEGFIFKYNSDALSYIINFCKLNKIPIVLETKFENFKNELKYLKGLIHEKIGGLKKNYKKLILKIFNSLLNFHETLGKSGNLSTRYRIDSYRRAIKTIEQYNKQIYSINDVKNLPNIGKGFIEKINEIINSGTLSLYENIKKNNKQKSINLFQDIWGIGPEFAKYIVKKNIKTIKELRIAVKNNIIILNTQQKLGLKYYYDLKKKIPRTEITNITNIIKKLIETDNIKIYNAGSYRIGKKYSGDIDLIITYNEKLSNLVYIKKMFYDKLTAENIIIETLLSGNNKSIYIVQFENGYYRKIDIAYVEQSKLPWYLLYFGSSREFSKKIRATASKKGYKLTEKGLYDKNTDTLIDFIPKDEENIFKYLNIEYVKPENRL